MRVAPVLLALAGAAFAADPGGQPIPAKTVAAVAPATDGPMPGQSAGGPLAGSASGIPPAPGVGQTVLLPSEFNYNPMGRREPFKAIIKDGKDEEKKPNSNIPPLQRLSLTELNLIGIVWGGFGFTAMVQTPDGKGYTVRPGTRVGPNNGVVSSITENTVVVQERYTDVYGNKQVREYIKLLHAKEGVE